MAKKKTQPKNHSEFFNRVTASIAKGMENLEFGKKLTAHTVVKTNPPRIMSPAEIIRIRESMRVSQQVFATLLNTSVKSVQAWEQGLRKPGGPSLRLLYIAKICPESLLRAI